MNILETYSKVNPDTLKPQQRKQYLFEIASEILYLESPLKENFTECESQLGYTFHKLTTHEKIVKQNRCPQNIPFVIAENPQGTISKHRKNKDKKKLYPEAFENSSHIKLFKKVTRQTLARFCSQWGVAGIKINDEWKFFVANAKGTQNYFKKQYWRFHDVCGELDKHYSQHFFDTVTCNPEQFSSDLIVRYKQFSDRIGEYCRYMAREIKGKVVCVIESTASGLPHAHLIYYTNKIYTDIKERHKKGTRYNYIYDGRLKQCSLKWWQDGFCELRKDEKGDTANYLSKYLSKVSETNLISLLKKEHWSKTDWKMVFTVLLPVLSCVRQFRLPQLKNLPNQEAGRERKVEFLEKEKSSTNKESAPLSENPLILSARLRAYLKALMIKSPIPCITQMVFAQYRAFVTDNGDDFDKINAKLPEEKENIAKRCSQFSCGGCPYAQMFKNVLFDTPFYSEGADNTKYFESYFFQKWMGVYKRVGCGERWANDEKEQDLFIAYIINKICKKCGGSVATGSLQLMLEKHHSLWAMLLPKEVFSFGVELITFFKDDIVQKEDSLKVYEVFQKTFRNFLLTISASGVILTQYYY